MTIKCVITLTTVQANKKVEVMKRQHIETILHYDLINLSTFL